MNGRLVSAGAGVLCLGLAGVVVTDEFGVESGSDVESGFSHLTALSEESENG